MDKSKNATVKGGGVGYDSLKVLTGGIEFLKDSNTRLSKAVLYMGIALVVVAALACVSLLYRSKPVYFAVTPDLRVVELKPLSEPYLTENGVRDWTVNAVVKTFSLDFLHWRTQLTDVSSDYTPDAFKALLASMKQADLINMVDKQRLDVALSLTGAAVVTNSYTQNGILYVRVNIPLVISYENSQGPVGQQNLLADVLVRRVPVTSYPSGIAIDQIVMSQQQMQVGQP